MQPPPPPAPSVQTGGTSGHFLGSAIDFGLGFIPGYDLYRAFTNPDPSVFDYAVGILGVAPGLGKGAGLGLKGARFLAQGPLKFGQATVKSTFAHGPFAGETIGVVAAKLRSGLVSPDQLPVEFIVRNGERVALNNRSLLALRRARMDATVAIDRTAIPQFERLLDRHLAGTQPSDFIRVRGGPPGTSLIE
jgi:hypothetical protein